MISKRPPSPDPRWLMALLAAVVTWGDAGAEGVDRTHVLPAQASAPCPSRGQSTWLPCRRGFLWSEGLISQLQEPGAPGKESCFQIMVSRNKAGGEAMRAQALAGGREQGRPGAGCAWSRGKRCWRSWGTPVLVPALLSMPGHVALGRHPPLSGHSFPICMKRPWTKQHVASELFAPKGQLVLRRFSKAQQVKPMGAFGGRA